MNGKEEGINMMMRPQNQDQNQNQNQNPAVKKETESQPGEEGRGGLWQLFSLQIQDPPDANRAKLQTVKKEELYNQEMYGKRERIPDQQDGVVKFKGVDCIPGSAVGGCEVVLPTQPIYPPPNCNIYQAQPQAPKLNLATTYQFPGGSYILQPQVTTVQHQQVQKSYKCDICNKEFPQMYDLERHSRLHTTVEKPFKCQVCDKGFTDAADLKRHRRVHTSGGDKQFDCSVCGKVFSTSYGLRRHFRIHTGEKPFRCETCERQFTCSNHLNQHIKTHTGEKPFKCNICDKEFSTTFSLKRHRTIHSTEKPFKCDTCGKQFSTFNCLNYHMKVHLKLAYQS